MNPSVESSQVVPHEYDGDALVVTHHSAETLMGSLTALDAHANGYFSQLFNDGDLHSEVGKLSVHCKVPGLRARCVIVVGAGSKDAWNADVAFRCGGAATKRLADRERGRVGLCFGPLDSRTTAAAVAGALNGCTGQDLFRHEKKLQPPQTMEWLSSDFDSPGDAVTTGLKRGVAIGQAMLLARELVNLPANYLYPESFVQRAVEVAVSEGIEFEVWDELRLRRERCNALLAVSAASARPPRLLILRYAGRKTAALGTGWERRHV